MAKHAGHDERRSAFAAAAFRALARDGLAGLTVRNVAREAGYTTGALVHYYPSKDQLFVAASEHAALVVRPRMEHDETYGGIESLRRVIFDALPTTAEARDLWSVWLVFWDRGRTDPVIGKLAQERYAEWQGRLERLIRRGQDDGVIDPAADAALLAQTATILVDGIAIQTLRTSARLSARRQRAVIDTWIAGIASEGRKPAARRA